MRIKKIGDFLGENFYFISGKINFFTVCFNMPYFSHNQSTVFA